MEGDEGRDEDVDVDVGVGRGRGGDLGWDWLVVKGGKKKKEQ